MSKTSFFKLQPTFVASKIFSYLAGAERQRIRAVCRDWKVLIDDYYGIKVQVTDANWKWVKSNSRIICARMINVNHKTNVPTGLKVCLAKSLKYLEVMGETTYDFFLPILKQCLNLQSLTLNIPAVPFSISRTADLEFFDGINWLPNLTNCKLIISCTPSSKNGHYWKQLNFVELIFRILNTTPVRHLDINANGSNWWLPLHSMFLQIPYINIFSEELNLSRLNFLPMYLLQESLESITFLNDYTLKLSMLPLDLSYNSWPEPGLDLEHVDFDVGSGRMWMSKGWHEILKNQTNLKELIYEIHYGSEMRKRVLRVLNSNETLRFLKFHGNDVACHGMESFDGGWFHKLINLERLELIGERSEDKIYFKKPLPMLTRPWYLPASLKILIVHGYIDCGRVFPGIALENLENLVELELMGRYNSPWFLSDCKRIFEINSTLLQDLYESLPRLEYFKLLWITPPSLKITGIVEQAYINNGLKEWCSNGTLMTMNTSQCKNEALCSEVKMWDG